MNRPSTPLRDLEYGRDAKALAIMSRTDAPGDIYSFPDYIIPYVFKGFHISCITGNR